MAILPDWKRNTLGARSIVDKYKLKKFAPIILLLFLVIMVVIWQVSRATNAGRNQDNRVQVSNAKATAQVNKEFLFPVKNSKGAEVTKMKYFVESAELRDEIIVKGQKATAVQGRLFLILTIKITNDYTKSLEINAKDYIRLSMNGKDGELLAADIHNDPVLVQPVSTKYTRIGFPINDTDKQLVLNVGELEGKKEKVELNF